MSIRTDSIEAECRRRASAKTRVLQALLDAGATGCTNVALCAPDVGGMRFAARAWELQEAGWDIAVQKERGGVWRYILRGRKEPVQQRMWEVGA